MVRIPREWREDADRLGQLPVFSLTGRQVPLGEVTDIIEEEPPLAIEHEAIKPRKFV